MKRALALALLALPALPSAASGAVSFEPTVSPTTIAYRPGGEVSYRLQIRSGPTAERFDLSVDQPRYDSRVEGYPVAPERLSIEGPGALGTITQTQPALAAGRCSRGLTFVGTSAKVSLPANTTSTFVARFRMSADDAPFRSTDLRATFVASGGTLIGEQRFRPARPRLTGPFGVFVDLATRPRSTFTGNPRPLRIRLGRSLQLRGAARSIRRQLVDLRYVGPGTGSRSRRIARVRVDSRGNFGRRFRPRRRGFYEVFAAYRRQRSNLTSDRSCLRSFRVR